jgi:hypothetical protein
LGSEELLLAGILLSAASLSPHTIDYAGCQTGRRALEIPFCASFRVTNVYITVTQNIEGIHISDAILRETHC